MKLFFMLIVLASAPAFAETAELKVPTCRLAYDEVQFKEFNFSSLLQQKGYKLITLEALKQEILTNPMTLMKLAGSLGTLASGDFSGGVPKDLAEVMCKKAKGLLFFTSVVEQEALRIEIGEGPQDVDACVQGIMAGSGELDLTKFTRILYKGKLSLIDSTTSARLTSEMVMGRLSKIPQCVKSKK